MSERAVPESAAWPASLAVRIDKICVRFEEAYQKGQRPNLEHCLREAPEMDRPKLLRELLSIELAYRKKQGESPGIKEYLHRFPQLSNIAALFADSGILPVGIDQNQDATLWHIAWNNQKIGPFTLNQLVALVRRGELTPADMLLQHGQSQWVKADSVPGLLESAQVTQPQTSAVSAPSQESVKESISTIPYHAETGSTPETALPMPEIKGYEIVEELGRGGMGVVYKAHHTALKRLVALKMIRGGSLANAEEVMRFRLEAEAVARLQHANIVQIHEIGEHQGQPFFSLEFVEGGTLTEKWGNKPQLPVDAANLVETLANAVHDAHLKGIVHRDLKPANVLLKTDGTPKISDFGLAKQLDNDSGHTQTGQILGTPSYMAPEQALGKNEQVGPSTDIYSLGAILYWALTGQPPFRGANVAETLDLVRTKDPTPPRQLQSRIPRDLETICLKCLEKDPQRRYRSAQDLADDLNSFRAGKPIKARPIGAPERSWRWIKRHPVMTAVASVSFALLLGMLVWWQSRPAYLDVRIAPADARATLDGEPIDLKNGNATLQRSPGRYLLEITAKDHLPHKQQLVLVRGQENTVIADVKLESALGYVHVASNPDGAKVQLINEKSKKVYRGTSPFHSQNIPAGDYLVKLDKELYFPTQYKVIVPTGNRTVTPPMAVLKPRDTKSNELFFFMKQTRQTIDATVFSKVPFIRLREFLKILSARSGIECVINRKEFRRENPDAPDVGETEISNLPRGKTSLRALLKIALQQVPSQNATYTPTKIEGQKYRFEIVPIDTSMYALKHTILHQAGDLVTGPNRMTVQRLIQLLTQNVKPGTWYLKPTFVTLPPANSNNNPGNPRQPKKGTPAFVDAGKLNTVEYFVGAGALQVKAPWSYHEEIDTYLNELRTIYQHADRAPSENDQLHKLIRLTASEIRVDAIPAGIKLDDFLAALSARVSVKFVLRADALQSAQLLTMPVVKSLPKGKAHALREILYSVLAPLKLTYIPQKIADREYGFEIVSARDAKSEGTVLIYNIRDLLKKRPDLQPNYISALLQSNVQPIQNAFRQPNQFVDVRSAPATNVLTDSNVQIRASWDFHEHASEYLKELANPAHPRPILLKKHTGGVSNVAFFPDGRRLLSIGADNKIVVWDVKEGKAILSVNGSSAAFSPNGQKIAFADQVTVKTTDSATGSKTQQLWKGKALVMPYSSIAYDPSGNILVAGHLSKTFDAANGKETKLLQGVPTFARNVAFSSDGKYLAMVGIDSKVRVWETKNGRLVSTFGEQQFSSLALITSAITHPTQPLLATATSYGKISLRDVVTGKVNLSLAGRAGMISGMAFGPKGRYLAVANSLGGMSIWDLKAPRQAGSINEFIFFSVAIGPDGEWLATGGSDGAVRIWKTNSLFTKTSTKTPLTNGTIKITIGKTPGPFEIRVDGRAIAPINGTNEYQMPTGEHVVYVTGKDFVPAMRAVTIRPGNNGVVSFDLKASK